LGACFEQKLPAMVQAVLGEDVACDKDSSLYQVMSYLLRASPSFSLRGGTREILRGIIAKGLGLR
jgi:acyl-CoA dehydrogenase